MTRKSAIVLAVLAVLALAAATHDIPYLTAAARSLLLAATVLAAVWLVVRAGRRLLWRVGRRLTFSYFLIGALPIPMVFLLCGVAAYLLSCFFLGHLYRDAVEHLRHDLVTAAETRLAQSRAPARGGGPPSRFVFAFYQRGARTVGDTRAPLVWPSWLTRETEPAAPHQAGPFVAFPDGSLGLAATAGTSESGVVALLGTEVAGELSDASDVWVELPRPNDPQAREPARVKLFEREFALQPLRRQPLSQQALIFFARRGGTGFWDRPFLVWGEISGPLRSLADGQPVSGQVLATLRGAPATIHHHLFSSNAEVNTSAWAALITVGFLLFDVYAVAVLMAGFLIFGLSRAVNRLSRATSAVSRGDFSARIPVRRKDQLGDLQRSFNQMAADLQGLVAAAAQQEALHKELEVARALQKSLIPMDPMRGRAARERVEFSTYFEPSAAIGGDYFDILRVAHDRLAVVIADVSGHGLSAGLRMAMLKAALQILIDDEPDPETILRRLDALIRTRDEVRSFVTASLSLIDLRSGELVILNAGHPPAYHLRGGTVEEILLPSSPLGGIGQNYARLRLRLQTGDLMVWLSDGLIEATNVMGDPLGYEQIAAVLAGSTDSAAVVRDRLLEAVRHHTGGAPAEDDRTLVVMRYEPELTAKSAAELAPKLA